MLLQVVRILKRHRAFGPDGQQLPGKRGIEAITSRYRLFERTIFGVIVFVQG